MKIILKTKDIKQTYSASGTIIDELAYSAGQWTEEDLHNNNYDYENEVNSYIFEHFDFEDALLKATKTATDLLEIASKLSVYIVPNDKMMKQKPKLQAGASCALNMPDKWSELLNAYTEKCKDEQYNFHNSEFLSLWAPELEKELEKAENSFWNNLTREWLYGDHRDYNGILYEIKKYWDAEEIVFNDKNWDEVILHFEDEQEDEDGKKMNAKQYKAYLLDLLQYKSEMRHNKEQAQCDENKAKRAEQSAYKAKRQAEADAERKAKLLSLKAK